MVALKFTMQALHNSARIAWLQKNGFAPRLDVNRAAKKDGTPPHLRVPCAGVSHTAGTLENTRGVANWALTIITKNVVMPINLWRAIMQSQSTSLLNRGLYHGAQCTLVIL